MTTWTFACEVWFALLTDVALYHDLITHGEFESSVALTHAHVLKCLFSDERPKLT